MVGLKMLLSPISLTKKANILKIGGPLGGAVVATIVLELITQALTKTIPQVDSIASDQIPGIQSVPFIGEVTLRDVPSLTPAIAGGLAILKGRTKVGAMMIAGSVAGKAGLRAAGLNPDELWNKLRAKFTNHKPNNEEDFEQEGEVYF